MNRAMTGGRWASFAALGGLLLMPGLWFGPTFDAAAFMLVGSGIRAGGMPYRDFWDDKPPGLYLLNAISQAGLPWLDRWLVCWLLSLSFTVAAAIIFESLLRPRVGALVAWGAALVLLCFVASYPMALGGGYGETFALPFVLGAVWILSRSERRFRDVAATGALLSIACLLSLQSAPAAVAIGLATAASMTIRPTLGRFAVLGMSGLAIPLVLAGWLILGGAGQQAYDVVVRYNSDFYRLNGQSLFWLRLMLAGIVVSALLPSVAAQVVSWLRGRRRPDRVEAACAGWLVAAVLSFAYEQRVFMHYLILVAPALIVIGAPAFVRLSKLLRSPRAAARRVAIVAQSSAAAMLIVILLWGAQWPGSSAGITNAWHADETAVSGWVRDNTPASATVFVWGDHPEIYIDADRWPACRWIFMDPMTTRGYWSQEATNDLLAQWQANPPAVVVETPAAIPLFREGVSAADDPRTYDVLAGLRSFVRDGYRLAHTQGQADVWLRR